MKKYKNIIIAAVVVVLAGAVIALALNGGQSQAPTGAPGMDMDGQNGGGQIMQGDPFDEKNPVAGNEIKFSTKDVDENDIDDSVFKDSKLTVINLWGTFCAPCIEEMPDLQKLQEEYKGKLKVIGLVDSTETSDQVKQVLKEKNITYTNIIANKELSEQLVHKFDYVPATLFIDSEGKVIEKFIPGGANYEIFKQYVDELLENK